jgi:hypothetical protein
MLITFIQIQIYFCIILQDHVRDAEDFLLRALQVNLQTYFFIHNLFVICFCKNVF